MPNVPAPGAETKPVRILHQNKDGNNVANAHRALSEIVRQRRDTRFGCGNGVLSWGNRLEQFDVEGMRSVSCLDPQ